MIKSRSILGSKICIDFVIYLYKEQKTNVFNSSLELRRTYCHMNNVVNFLDKEHITSSIKNGRNRFVTLTEKGKRITEHLMEIQREELY